MRGSMFSYALMRPYPYKWLPFVVLVGGVCATAILTVLNLAANGYELYNVYTMNPNATISPENQAWFEKSPWSWTNLTHLSSPDNLTGISSVLLSILVYNQNSENLVELYTKVHTIRYTVTDLSVGSEESLYSMAYLDDYLQNCHIVQLKMSWPELNSNYSISDIQASCIVHNGTVPVTITLTPELDYDDIQMMKTHHSYRPDVTRVGVWLGSSIASWYTSSRNISQSIGEYGVTGSWELANVHINDQTTEKSVNRTRLKDSATAGSLSLVHGSQYSDDYQTDAYVYASSIEYWNSVFGLDMIAEKMIGLLELSPTGKPSGSRIFDSATTSDPHTNATLFADGTAKSIYSMILSDLGQSDDTNIFASPQRAMEFLKRTKDLNPVPNPWDEFVSITAWEKLVDAVPDPSAPPNDVMAFYDWAHLSTPQVQPTRFSMQYLCQIPKLKSAGSLFVSVVIPDFVFLQVIWTIFNWIMVFFLERQHPDAWYCTGCSKAIDLGQLNLDEEKSNMHLKQKRVSLRSALTMSSPPSISWSDSIEDGTDIKYPHSIRAKASFTWPNGIGIDTNATHVRSASMRKGRKTNSRSLILDV